MPSYPKVYIVYIMNHYKDTKGATRLVWLGGLDGEPNSNPIFTIQVWVGFKFMRV